MRQAYVDLLEGKEPYGTGALTIIVRRMQTILEPDNFAFIEYTAKTYAKRASSSGFSGVYDGVYIADARLATPLHHVISVEGECTIREKYSDIAKCLIGLVLIEPAETKLRWVLEMCTPVFERNPERAFFILDYNDNLLWPK